jgi:hypothetical protein
MAIVERMLTIPQWAERISVQRDGETLVVQGEDRRATPVPPDDLPPGQDLLQQYTQYSKLWSEKRSGKRAPHIQFANSTDDDALIAFVGRFGPVQTKGKLWRSPNRTLTAYQDIQGLRRDRLIFSGATKILVASERGDVDARDVLADGLAEILRGACQPGPTQEIHTEPTFRECPWYGYQILPFAKWLCRQEDFKAATDSLQPDTLVKEALRYIGLSKLRRIAQIALSILLNCFPPHLTAVGSRMLELPTYDECGILPVLYFMLRQDCLRGRAIVICARPECGAFFAVERFGQRFCSAQCSQLQRQRDYWQRKGKEARALRIARSRNQKGGKRRGTVQVPR